MSSVNVLTLQDSLIPERLRNIPDAPKQLYTRGSHTFEDLLVHPIVAIVGSRKVDSYGAHATKMLASELAENGVVIASGLALGTDVFAHKACLDTGTPSIAIIASGILNITPRANADTARRIIENGVLVSENSGQYEPRKYDFLIRNRLISGLADAVIVPQASARSGSLNTARHALEQGKIVMAVPGPITNPLCEGPNNLLKMGALPVTSAQDVFNALNLVLPTIESRDYELLAENESELKIIQLIHSGYTDGETIAIQLALPAQEFNVHLTMLEIRGVIRPLGANQWALR